MEKVSQMSMLEVACMIMEQKRSPQPMKRIIKEVLEMKGFDKDDAYLSTQLYMDITTSSKFVYMGNEEWDIKTRQSLDEWDKDGSAFNSKEDLIDEEIELVLPVDDFDDEEDAKDLDADEEFEEEDDLDDDDLDDDDLDDEEDDEIDDEEDDLDTITYISDDIDNDYMDEDKYNDYMDNYEDMYDQD